MFFKNIVLNVKPRLLKTKYSVWASDYAKNAGQLQTKRDSFFKKLKLIDFNTSVVAIHAPPSGFRNAKYIPAINVQYQRGKIVCDCD